MEQKTIQPVMYIFVNKSLGMSPGKMAAQVAHGAVEAYVISDKTLRDLWRLPEKFYIKIVLEAQNATHLETIQKYLNEREVKSALIIDEGRTELAPHQMTVLGVEVIDKNKLGKIFSQFKLYTTDIDIKITLK